MAKLRKREAQGRVQDDEHLFLTNRKPKREIDSFYFPGTSAFPLLVGVLWLQLLKRYTLLNLGHMTILTPPGFEMNEIYSMYTKEELCCR